MGDEVSKISDHTWDDAMAIVTFEDWEVSDLTYETWPESMCNHWDNCDCVCQYCKRHALGCLRNPCPGGVLNWCESIPGYKEAMYGGW